MPIVFVHGVATRKDKDKVLRERSEGTVGSDA